MLVGDSVLLQDKDNNILRPSDIGKAIKVADTWTLVFNNGAKITTTGETKFQTNYNGNPEFVSLDNMSRATMFGSITPFVFPDTTWDSVIELSDYTNKEGKFDLNNLDFAFFSGLFLRCHKTVMTKPDAYVIDRKYDIYKDIISSLYPKEFFSKDKKHLIFKKCWMTELIDVLFGFTDIISIPDDLINSASIEWLNRLGEGFIAGCYFDATKNGYTLSDTYEQFLFDYAIYAMRANKNYVLQYKEQPSTGARFYTVKFPERAHYLNIIDGYENQNPQVLYDVGEGPYNAFGVIIKD